jgi:arylsulfatase
MYDLFPEASYTALRGGKGDVLESGVHVPGVAWWPGVIEQNQISAEMIHVTDMYTTAARIGGALGQVPKDRVTDGIEQS